MDYSVYELDATGQPLRNVSYDAVTLTKDKQFTAQINDESIADASSYDLASEGKTIGATSDDYVKLTGLHFEKSEESIYVDNTATLTVSKTPENASETIFRWESSDPSVAEVDAYGTVTGISAGTAEISCISKIDDTVKATVTVTVSAVPTALPIMKPSVSRPVHHTVISQEPVLSAARRKPRQLKR